MSACGLDFGTSNTTCGAASGGPRLVPLEGAEVTIPSAIFFAPEGGSRVGRSGIEAYVDGEPGRLMRGLKSVLGKAALEETTQIGRERMTFHGVIQRYVGAIKARAEQAVGRELTAVVHGRPVHFVDGDAAEDRKAEEALRAIAHAVGFRDVSFAYEPIAAALDYERNVDGEEIALIADIGGGTSDFSIVRLTGGRARSADRKSDILANDGIRVGGTDFDRLLSLKRVMPELGYGSAMRRTGLDVPSSYFHDLATWSSINRLYAPEIRREVDEVGREAARPDLVARLAAVLSQERGHTLAMDVEGAKIALSEAEATRVPLDWLDAGLFVPIDRRDLVAATARLTERLRTTVAACIRAAGLRPDAIDALFLTGGSTRLMHARAAITAAVPAARVVEGDTFGSVGIGLAIEAARRHGIDSAEANLGGSVRTSAEPPRPGLREARPIRSRSRPS